METTTNTRTINDLAAQADDLCKIIQASSLDDAVKAILTKQLMDCGWAFTDALSEKNAATVYMARATDNAANFIAAADDLDLAARAARKAADAMRTAELKRRDAERMWEALNS